MQNCYELLALAQEFGVCPVYQSGRLSCAFVGEWNAGKTSLINTLIGTTLPVKPISTTKTIVRIMKGSEIKTEVEYESGEIKRKTGFEATELAKEASVSGNIRRIDYTLTNLNIPNDVIFVDTPGFNDEDISVVNKAANVLADVIIFVIQAPNAIFNKIQKDFIEQALIAKGNSLDDIYFVITHEDLLDVDNKKHDMKEIIERLKGELSDKLNSNQFYFVNTQHKESVYQFQKSLYSYIDKKIKNLLPSRNRRLFQTLIVEMRNYLAKQKSLITIGEDNRENTKKILKEKINEAVVKERYEREKIRSKNRELIASFDEMLRLKLDSVISQIDIFIDNISDEELRSRGRLEKEILTRLKSEVEPLVIKQAKEIQEALENNLTESELISCNLVNEIGLGLPEYAPRFTKISAEGIIPLAVIGTLLTFGWFSVPFFAAGFLALHADTLGFTGKHGFLNIALDRIKKYGRQAYKKAVKMTVIESFSQYRLKIVEYLQDITNKAMDLQFAKIGHAATLQKELSELLADQGLENLKLRIHRLEILLSGCCQEIGL